MQGKIHTISEDGGQIQSQGQLWSFGSDAFSYEDERQFHAEDRVTFQLNAQGRVIDIRRLPIYQVTPKDSEPFVAGKNGKAISFLEALAVVANERLVGGWLKLKSDASRETWFIRTDDGIFVDGFLESAGRNLFYRIEKCRLIEAPTGFEDSFEVTTSLMHSNSIWVAPKLYAKHFYSTRGRFALTDLSLEENAVELVGYRLNHFGRLRHENEQALRNEVIGFIVKMAQEEV